MKIIGLIPARYESKRFPGKVLENAGGLSVLQRVYDLAKKVHGLSDVFIATDHQKVKEHAHTFGGEVIFTSNKPKNGTERCHEALVLHQGNYDYVLNIQADEAFIDPGTIDSLVNSVNKETSISTLISRVHDTKTLLDPNVVKVVIGQNNKALYFSRQPIPFIRDTPLDEWIECHSFFRHLGVYLYKSEILREIVNLPKSTLEQSESLEQLRWMEHNYDIETVLVDDHSLAIDTPDNLNQINE